MRSCRCSNREDHAEIITGPPAFVFPILIMLKFPLLPSRSATVHRLAAACLCSFWLNLPAAAADVTFPGGAPGGAFPQSQSSPSTSNLSTAAAAVPAGWKLIWSDEFNDSRIDDRKWVRCERGRSDWNDTMTNDPRCYKLSDGTLKLIGIVNPNTAKDPSPFLTGGLTSKGKFQFKHGRIEIRARFKSAQGAWPALWMLGEKGGWPRNGEIDLMEHLNFDESVYQTIHSGYTHQNGGGQPPKSTFAKIDRDGWNTYGAEWDAQKIVFSVNGTPTLTYPKVPGKGADQWPFEQPFYIILSMQIGGAWVGKADPKDYPADLEIDWVRVYQSTKR